VTSSGGTPGSGSSGRQRRAAGQGQEANAGWTIFGYMISGMAAYGGIGWLVGHFTHLPLLFPVGMLVGIVLAIVGILYRYGRP
jgi:F0F1-type ATP synthase assembly protein I